MNPKLRDRVLVLVATGYDDTRIVDRGCYIDLFVEAPLPNGSLDSQKVTVGEHPYFPDDAATLWVTGQSGCVDPEWVAIHAANLAVAARLCRQLRKLLAAEAA